MADAPAYKGSVFQGPLLEVKKHLESGEISREDAERILTPEDFELMEGVIVASALYPLLSYQRFCQLLFEVIGHGDVEYLIEAGRRNARRLLDESRMYAQYNHAERAEVLRLSDPEERFEALGRDLDLLSMSGTTRNFGETVHERDPDHPLRWMARVSVPAQFSDVITWREQGFRNEVASRHGHSDIWVWERPTPTQVVWRMTRDA